MRKKRVIYAVLSVLVILIATFFKDKPCISEHKCEFDSKGIKDFDKWVDTTLKTSVTYPSTIIVDDGAVKAKKDGALQYYYLKDFITNNK